jgi:hypothetical protein
VRPLACATALLLLIGCDERKSQTGLEPAPRTEAMTQFRGPKGDTAWTQPDIQSVAINNVLDRFHEAATKADFEAYFAAWTQESVFLGTDATERWLGDQFKDFARPIFEKGKGWAYHPHDRHISVLPDGKSAYFDELLDNDKLGLCRGSGVLAKRGDDWKILQYNLSIPIPNDLAAGIVDTIRKAPPSAPAAHPVSKPSEKPKE